MSTPSILLGAVLTFGSSDGRTLQLAVSTTRPATVALSWGELAKSSSVAKSHHLFRALPLPPPGAPLTYALGVSGEPPRRVTVRPIDPARLAIAVYGDSRDGSAPHAQIVRAIDGAQPDVVVHTGDVVHSADDAQGWVRHLAATLPLSAHVPLILSLGNHETYDLGTGPPLDPLVKAMTEIPPPEDPLAREMGVPASVFHVRVGPALFISLDSNGPLGAGTAQYRFLMRALEEKGDAKFLFVAYHQGPLASGPHGPHPDAGDLIAVLEKYHVTASLAGHDHVYERLVRHGITYLVSGGGGAPLYPKSREVEGSEAFASTYNWAMISADALQDRVTLEAYSLEGALLDRATIVPAPASAREGGLGGMTATMVLAAIGLLAAALIYVLVSLARYRPAE